MFDWIHLWIHLSLGFCFLGDFWSQLQFTVLVILLFIISISSWFSLGRLNFSNNLFLPDYLFYCNIVVHNTLIIICISALSLVTSPFSFLILFIRNKFFCSLMSLAKSFSIFVYLLKEPAFSFINLFYCFFHLFLLRSLWFLSFC